MDDVDAPLPAPVTLLLEEEVRLDVGVNEDGVLGKWVADEKEEIVEEEAKLDEVDESKSFFNIVWLLVFKLMATVFDTVLFVKFGGSSFNLFELLVALLFLTTFVQLVVIFSWLFKFEFGVMEPFEESYIRIF